MVNASIAGRIAITIDNDTGEKWGSVYIYASNGSVCEVIMIKNPDDLSKIIRVLSAEINCDSEAVEQGKNETQKPIDYEGAI